MDKKKLLKKIEHLFFDHTFKEVSMLDIAEELDIKKASLYYYFPSKEDLQKALIEESFQEYKRFISEILDKDFKEFLWEFVYYPQKSKNLFSVINQSWYCDDDEAKKSLQIKQKEIFDMISSDMSEKYDFSIEKTFLLISLLEDIGRKKCLFGDCPIDIDRVIWEIEDLFG